MNTENQISISDQVFALATTLEEKPDDIFRQRLTGIIQELINNDFTSLVQLLYRIDVDEKKLKQLLKQHAGSDSASIIADLIISRQLQKIAIKKQFTGREKPGPDDSW